MNDQKIKQSIDRIEVTRQQKYRMKSNIYAKAEKKPFDLASLSRILVPALSVLLVAVIILPVMQNNRKAADADYIPSSGIYLLKDKQLTAYQAQAEDDLTEETIVFNDHTYTLNISVTSETTKPSANSSLPANSPPIITEASQSYSWTLQDMTFTLQWDEDISQQEIEQLVQQINSLYEK